MFEHVYAKISPEPNTGCWIWDGATGNRGYGNVSVVVNGKRKTRLAHGLIYEIEKGPVKPGLELDHLCRNRWCVNPDHLEQVTGSENCLRGEGPQLAAERNLVKTHCKQGHLFSDANSYIYKSRKGTDCRGCKTCRRAANLKWKGG